MPAVLLWAVFAVSPGPSNDRTDSLIWARGVAFHFVEAAVAGSPAEALAVATDEFRDRLRRASPRTSPDRAAAGVRRLVAPAVAADVGGAEGEPLSAWVTGEQLSPAGDEARFVGGLHQGKSTRDKKRADFSVIVVRTPEGKWRVATLSITRPTE